MSDSLPSIEFLLEAPSASLQDLELAALNRSDNLGKQIRVCLEQWAELKAAALMARWMIENREALLQRGAPARKLSFEELLDAGGKAREQLRK